MHPALHQKLFGRPGWVPPGASIGTDFASGRYFGGALLDNISVSRASTGYARTLGGLLVSSAANVLRVTDQGALIEEARTNAALRSQEFNDGSWVKVGVAVNANTGSVRTPNDTFTGDIVTASVGTNYHYTYQAPAAAAGTSYAFSIFVRAGTARYINFGDAGDASWHTAVLDTQTGLISATTNCTASAEAYTNGWFRVECRYTRTNSATHNIYVGPDTAGDSVTGPYFDAAGTETCIVWGAQLEAASFATSYIATTTVAVTRAADAATLLKTGIGRVVFTFDDLSTQTVSGIDTGVSYAIPTNLTRQIIRRLTGHAA